MYQFVKLVSKRPKPLLTSKKKEEVSEKKLDEKINSMNEDIKNYIHTSGHTKSTYINYEQKENIETTGNNSWRWRALTI